MRIGIDCDGVLRDLIPAIQDSVKQTHPHLVKQMKEPNDWGWQSWLPFWTEDETEKYVFEDNYLDFFGPECPPIKEAVEDWVDLKEWAAKYGHELILVSAQRPNCVEPTEEWLQRWGFVGFDEIHFEKKKHLVDVDVLIDDSPDKLRDFRKKSVKNGIAICYKQTWNKKCHTKYSTIDRLSDITKLV